MKLAAVILAILLFALPCAARTITVDANGTGDYPTIQAAIDDANNADVIVLLPGTYTGPGSRDIDYKGKAVTVRSTDPNDPNIVATTIIGRFSPVPVFRLFNEEDANTVLDGLAIANANYRVRGAIDCDNTSPTIKNCTFDSCSPAIYCIDAAPTIKGCSFNSSARTIYCHGADPVIEGCRFTSCASAISCSEAAPTVRSSTFILCSPAVYCDGAGPTIETCIFTSCLASYGGAIYCYESGPTITDCIISSSSAEHCGGAIYCEQDSSPTIDNCVFTNNTAQIGGAIYLLGSTSQLSNCTFRHNSTTTMSGGAIRINESVVTITDSIFENNSAQTAGGAINCSDDAVLILNNCFFGRCLAPMGGALSGAAGPMTITNCIFAGNWASQTQRWPFSEGGALAIVAGDMANCLFVGNSALYGGAILGGGCGDLSIGNCTFAGNRASQANTLYIHWPMGLDKLYGCQGADVSIADSIIWDGQDTVVSEHDDWTVTVTFCDVSGGQSSVDAPYGSVSWGPGNIDIDPCFADPGYWDPNGTPEDPNDDFFIDGDHHLKSQAGRYDPNSEAWVIDDVISPCIDAGDTMTPIMYEPFPNGGIINMGVYGGTPEASKSHFGEPVCETIVAGDINGDCNINFKDFFFVALHWLEEH